MCSGLPLNASRQGGALSGAKFVGSIGIAGGPLGAIAGTIPCAIVGDILGALGDNEIKSIIDNSWCVGARQTEATILLVESL